MRNLEMTWVPRQRRWTKVYQGKTFSVSCKQLHSPETKEESWRLANQWWRSKLASLPTDNHPRAWLLSEIDLRRAWAKQHSPQELANLERLRKLAEDPIHGEMVESPNPLTNDLAFAFEKETGVSLEHIPGETLARYFSQPVWEERLAQPVIEESQCLGELAKSFLERKKLTTAKSAGSIANYRLHLNNFLTGKLSPSMSAKVITEKVWKDFMTDLLTTVSLGKLSSSAAGDRVQTIKAFCKYLYSEGFIELPRNLGAYRIMKENKEIVVPTIEEVREVVKNIRGRMTLYMGLALNCGLNSVDIGKLTPESVVNGYLTRKRSKTAHHKNAPAVTYKLWPNVHTMLTKEGLPLTNNLGRPLWRRRESGGANDCIGMEWMRGDFPFQFKALRRFSASLLGSGPYGHFAQYFLAHAPSSTADRNYVKPSQEEFDKAIDWLWEKIKPPKS